jgi:hypothetical protein
MVQPKFDIGDDVLIRGTVKKIIINEDSSIKYQVLVNENGFDCLLSLESDQIIDIPKKSLIWGGGETC